MVNALTASFTVAYPPERGVHHFSTFADMPLGGAVPLEVRKMESYILSY